MRKRTDLIAGLAMSVFSLFLLLWLIPVHTSPPQSENNLSPAFLPSVTAAVMLALCLLLALVTWYSKDVEDEGSHEEFGEEARGIGLREATDIVLWAIFASAMMFGFVTIGFLFTAVTALSLLMLYAGVRSPLILVAVAVTVPLCIQQIAWHAFSVQLT